jgi:GTP-binding protein
MKISTAHFEQSAPDLKSCPAWALPEFAFIGRSNVGKSSLINLLAGRNALAKVSVTPGKTKLLNFFVLNGRWSLVDLPGYGYANVSHQDRDAFNRSVAEYLEGRRNLCRLFVLIDSRLPPQKIDLQFLQWTIEVGTPYALVFTKTDKLSQGVLERNIGLMKQSIAGLGGEHPPVFASSATKQEGRQEILGYVEKILAENSGA